VFSPSIVFGFLGAYQQTLGADRAITWKRTQFKSIYWYKTLFYDCLWMGRPNIFRLVKVFRSLLFTPKDLLSHTWKWPKYRQLQLTVVRSNR